MRYVPYLNNVTKYYDLSQLLFHVAIVQSVFVIGPSLQHVEKP